MTRRLLPLLLASCAVLASCAFLTACGSGGSQEHAAAPAGAALFTQACGACHTLTGHNDPRHQGGDLRDFRASRAQLTQFAAEMPVRRALTRQQLASVVAFVMSAEARR